jgi:DNA-binding IclR family transcriptional regulator
MTRPTVHGLLQTLQAHGFVEQDRDSDKYQLGAGLLQLGNSYLDLNELRGFCVAADLGSLGRAAVRLRVSQPSLSKRLASLETKVGTGDTVAILPAVAGG